MQENISLSSFSMKKTLRDYVNMKSLDKRDYLDQMTLLNYSISF